MGLQSSNITPKNPRKKKKKKKKKKKIVQGANSDLLELSSPRLSSASTFFPPRPSLSLLPLCSPVLEPYLHLLLCHLQLAGKCCPLTTTQIFLLLKHTLQLSNLA